MLKKFLNSLMEKAEHRQILLRLEKSTDRFVHDLNKELKELEKRVRVIVSRSSRKIKEPSDFERPFQLINTLRDKLNLLKQLETYIYQQKIINKKKVNTFVLDLFNDSDLVKQNSLMTTDKLRDTIIPFVLRINSWVEENNILFLLDEYSLKLQDLYQAMQQKKPSSSSQQQKKQQLINQLQSHTR